MTGRFEFSEPAARAFAARCLRQHAADNHLMRGGMYPFDPGPSIEPGWQPSQLADDELTEPEDLFNDALLTSAVTVPTGVWLHLVCIPGLDNEAMYMWRVGFTGSETCLSTAGFTPISMLANGAKGGHALVELIREGVTAANGLLDGRWATSMPELETGHVVQVVLTPSLRYQFREWLAWRGMYLFPIPVLDDLPTYGVGVHVEVAANLQPDDGKLSPGTPGE